MQHKVAPPTTPAEWCATRCQEGVSIGSYSSIPCEGTVTRKCDGCGKLVCPIHWRSHDFKEDSPELCHTCWEARSEERWAAMAAWAEAACAEVPRPKQAARPSAVARWLRRVARSDDEEGD